MAQVYSLVPANILVIYLGLCDLSDAQSILLILTALIIYLLEEHVLDEHVQADDVVGLEELGVWRRQEGILQE